MRRLVAGSPVHPIGAYLAALPRAAVVDFTPLLTAVDRRRPSGRRRAAGARLGSRAAGRGTVGRTVGSCIAARR